MTQLMKTFAAAMLCFVAAPALAGSNAIADLEAIIANTESLQGKFQQRTVDAQGMILEDSSGDFYFRKPAQFRWDYHEPFEQLIVADGEQVWLYDPGLEQVTIKPQRDDITDSPMNLLTGRVALDELFRVSATEAVGAERVSYRLLPRTEDRQSDFKRVLVETEGDRIVRIAMIDGFDQTTELQFDDLQLDQPIDDELFDFTPPAGVDVVGDADPNQP